MAHWRRVDLPMVLVCTHGRRDRCCARYGFPVFRHLHESLPQDMIWQTSHIGGHRFAATLLLFPHAYCYGQLSAETALDVVQAWSEGQLAHGHLLRGRTCYPRWAQAAEIAWRNRHQVTAVSAVEHVDGVSQHAPHASAPVDTSWTASLKTSSGTASVQVERVPLETAVPPSCGKAPEHTTAWTVVTPGRSPIGAR